MREITDGAHEFSYVPPKERSTENKAGRDNNGFQTGTVNGGIHVHGVPTPEPDPFLRRASEEEIDEVRNQFVAPGGMVEAVRALRTDRVVILCRSGTGRTFTARRLLTDLGARAVVDLDSDRNIRKIDSFDLRSGEGYVWDSRGLDTGLVATADTERIVSAVEAAKCWLVVIIDHRSQATWWAARLIVELRAPDAVEVATAVINRRNPDLAEAATQVVKVDLESALRAGDPPQKAVRAADLAMQVAAGDLTVEDAKDALTLEVDAAIRASLGDWTTVEYCMLVVVAVLEKQPYDRVVDQVLRLDDLVRNAELPEDKKLRPRRVFSKPKHQVLKEIRATTEEREHPRHPGLHEETVQFLRQDWAQAALSYVWREYHAIQKPLLEWMCQPDVASGFRGASTRALCTLITRVPAHDPLVPIEDLGSSQKYAHRLLAVATLRRLAEVHDMVPLVEGLLGRWVESGAVYRQWTAALVYGSDYSRRDPLDALKKLGRIGRSTNLRVQNAVVQGVLMLITRDDIRDEVMEAITGWANVRSFWHKENGLHDVGIALGMWIVGFMADQDLRTVEPVELARQYPNHIRGLAKTIFEDQEFGPVALSRLSELARSERRSTSRTSTGGATVHGIELLRLVRLYVADIRWWNRMRVERDLGARHPTRRPMIREILRVARKVERAVDRQVASGD